MPPEILRHAVQNQIGSVLKRTVDKRRGKGTVNNRENAFLSGNCGNCFQVCDQSQGICNDLGIEHFCILPYRRFHLFKVGKVHKADFNTKAGEDHLCELNRLSVNRFAHDDMISAFQQREQDGGNGRHAGRTDQRFLALLQKRDRGAQFIPVRVCGSVIVVSAAFIRKHIIFSVFKNIGACRIDGRRFGIPDDSLRSGSLVKDFGIKFVSHAFFLR